jgi:hypothetical protein
MSFSPIKFSQSLVDTYRLNFHLFYSKTIVTDSSQIMPRYNIVYSIIKS